MATDDVARRLREKGYHRSSREDTLNWHREPRKDIADGVFSLSRSRESEGSQPMQ